MYRIINTRSGAELGVTDCVVYIGIGSSGSFYPTAKDKAVGVALNGTAYNLLGHEEIQGADTVIVSEMDGGALAAELRKASEDADGMIVDQELRLTMLKLGLTDTEI